MSERADAAMEIERIIPPEIINDEFYWLIKELARSEEIKHVLEIGSSAGGGSTTAFVEALRANRNKPYLYCMEVSKPRFEALSQRYAQEGFVKCFNLSSVGLDEFPSAAEVSDFYRLTPTNLNQYPLEQVLGWLEQDIQYLSKSGVRTDGIEFIKAQAGIEAFDLVLIDGSEFTGAAELNHVRGAKFILLDDTNAFKCHQARARLLTDPDYVLVADNQTLRNGFSAFRRRDVRAGPCLPVHFFTIVLNGEPFIRYHIEAFAKLPFRWHWHIVEGVASLVHDTAWSVAGGGRVDDTLHAQGRSNDATSAYLDELARAHPDRVTIYRKPLGEFWDGKREMVSAPLANLNEECLLWQVDADEIWTPEQIVAMREAFHDDPKRTAAMFWCHYFVGPTALISTRYNYAENPAFEWRRLWRYKPGDHWAAHEPPRLMRKAGGRERDVAEIAPFTHDETEALGAVFQHFAYVTPEQMRFKELYYGYQIDLPGWRRMREDIDRSGPVFLRDYFPWVSDETMVDAAERQGVRPIATIIGGAWRFEVPPGAPGRTKPEGFPRVAIDGAFFQHNQKSGIARVWRALFEQWRVSGFIRNVVILDRAGTAPRMAGCSYRSIPAWNERQSGADAFMLQRICDEEGADLFVSSYYTSAISTPSMFLAHDFIPERLGIEFDDQNWREKHLALEHAALIACVSESTRADLLDLFPDVAPERAIVITNGVSEKFFPATNEERAAFKAKHGLDKPYFLMVGERLGIAGYKGGPFFLRALSQWPRRGEFEVVCVGGGPLEGAVLEASGGVRVRRLDLSDDELRAAYAAAQALVYPSSMEGFGLPVLEAMACGCPVVTTRAPALCEVGGEAPFYFDVGDAEGLRAALDRQLEPDARAAQIAAGVAHARGFNWEASAARYATALTQLAERVARGEMAPPSRLWRVLRAEQQSSQAMVEKLSAELPNAMPGLNSWLARSPLRSMMFAVRARLLKALPASLAPTARRGWRVLMGVRVQEAPRRGGDPG